MSSQPAAAPMTDAALIQMLISRGASKQNAECALNTLKTLGYNPTERQLILTDAGNNIHRVCRFGSIWPTAIILLAIVAVIVAILFELYCRLVTKKCDKLW